MQPGTQVLVERYLARIDLETVAEGAAERLEPGLVAGVFPCGQQGDPVDRAGGALRIGVEGTDTVDLVVEQVDPVGLAGAGRVEVDDRAAHGELPGLVDLFRRFVAGV